MLELDDVRYALGDASLRLSLGIGDDVPHVLLGRSGAGKSTLLNLIAGSIAPTSGDIRWRGRSLLGLPFHARPVDTLVQDHALFPHLDVARNVALGLPPELGPYDVDHDEVREALDTADLAGLAGRRPNTLSDAERRRAALARQLLGRAPVLLMDEPFGALAGADREALRELAREVLARRRPCTIVVTHDADDAAALGARVLRLVDGELRVEG